MATFKIATMLIVAFALAMAPALGQANPEKIVTRTDLAGQPMVVSNPNGEPILLNAGTHVIAFSRMTVGGLYFIRGSNRITKGEGYTIITYRYCTVSDEDMYLFQDKPGTAYNNQQEGTLRIACAGEPDKKIGFVYIVASSPSGDPQVRVDNYTIKSN